MLKNEQQQGTMRERVSFRAAAAYISSDSLRVYFIFYDILLYSVMLINEEKKIIDGIIYIKRFIRWTRASLFIV